MVPTRALRDQALPNGPVWSDMGLQMVPHEKSKKQQKVMARSQGLVKISCKREKEVARERNVPATYFFTF